MPPFRVGVVEQELRQKHASVAVATIGSSLVKVMPQSDKVFQMGQERKWMDLLSVGFVGQDSCDNGLGAALLVAGTLGASAFVGIADITAFDEDGGAVGAPEHR
jgi:hypothetical protein